MNHRHTYIARINRVVDYIDLHLGEPMDLATLAAVAHFSPFHFHRLFLALTGETLADHVRRRRLETAAARLLESPPAPVLNIALDVGFGSHEVFTRAFRSHFGTTPSAWRRGDWRPWIERHRLALRKIHQAERKAHQAVAAAFAEDEATRPWGRAQPDGGDVMEVQLETLPAARVAYLRHVGPYGTPGIPRMWERLMAWADGQGYSDPPRTMYGLSHDSADLTAPEKCRYDACIAVDETFRPQGEIGVQAVRGGRYACTVFHGLPTEIHAAWMRLWSDWLPDSGYQADDRPCIELYGADSTYDTRTGAFSCWLCLPVKPL